MHNILITTTTQNSPYPPPVPSPLTTTVFHLSTAVPEERALSRPARSRIHPLPNSYKSSSPLLSLSSSLSPLGVGVCRSRPLRRAGRRRRRRQFCPPPLPPGPCTGQSSSCFTFFFLSFLRDVQYQNSHSSTTRLWQATETLKRGCWA
jgi:hypothetical protein